MRKATVVLFICLCILTTGVLCTGQTNLSEERRLGIGVRFALVPDFSIFPWPFLGIQITDRIATGRCRTARGVVILSLTIREGGLGAATVSRPPPVGSHSALGGWAFCYG